MIIAQKLILISGIWRSEVIKGLIEPSTTSRPGITKSKKYMYIQEITKLNSPKVNALIGKVKNLITGVSATKVNDNSTDRIKYALSILISKPFINELIKKRIPKNVNIRKIICFISRNNTESNYIAQLKSKKSCISKYLDSKASMLKILIKNMSNSEM